MSSILLIYLIMYVVLVVMHTCEYNYTVYDIDECAEDIDDCAQVCTDTNLGCNCSCRSGYRLASNGRGCDGKTIMYLI